jgi:GNAT superfamily N-acetyltransferase
MKIRTATNFDAPKIIEMLKHFRSHTPIPEMNDCNDEIYISKLIRQLILGMGIIYVAEKNSEVVGMIIGVKGPSIWDQELIMLREMAFWVEPEHRGSTAGYKLILAYNKYAQQLKENKQITTYTMTKMSTSPDLDFGRFGYKKAEEVWVAGA